MELNNASITILISQDKTTIEIRDNDASVTFVKATLTPEQLSSALSRLSQTNCKAEIFAFDKVGKKHETEYFEFDITGYNKADEDKLWLAANEALKKQNMSDWKPDKYFGSQNSFFSSDGKDYARVVIRRWI